MDTPSTPPGGMFQGASPKLTFIFGLIAGVAATAVLGLLLILPKAYGAASKTKTAASTTTANTNTTPTDPFAPAGNVKPVTNNDYIRGDKNAKLTMIEYSDLECPYCKKFHPTLKDQAMKDYDGKIRWVYRQFPLSFHANAQKESEAALCVGQLGGGDKYWSFIDKIFERTNANGTGFALEALGPLAKEVGVNQTKFQKCLDGGEMKQQVADELADGGQGGASGTPTTFLVGPDGKALRMIPGAYPYENPSQPDQSVKAQIEVALGMI